MSISFIARMTIHPEKEAEFKAITKSLEAAVQEKEPGTLYYRFFKLEGDNQYAVIESFKDEAAEEAHMNSDHLQAVMEPIMACLDGPYVREYLYDID